MARNSAPDENTNAETADQAPATPAPAVISGLQAAENRLAETDEDVTRLWTTKGPKGGRVEQIGAFMHLGAVVLALVYKSGKFKLYQAVPEPVAQD